MKGIIIYKTKYGTTKKYVDWLIEDTKFDSIEVDKANINSVKDYDTIILCGPVYASSIKGLSFIRKNYNNLKDKKLAIFGVGASPLEDTTIENLMTFSIKKDLKEIPLFYGRGAMDEDNLSFKDKMLCKLLRQALKKQDPSTYVIIGNNVENTINNPNTGDNIGLTISMLGLSLIGLIGVGIYTRKKKYN